MWRLHVLLNSMYLYLQFHLVNVALIVKWFGPVIFAVLVWTEPREILWSEDWLRINSSLKYLWIKKSLFNRKVWPTDQNVDLLSFHSVHVALKFDNFNINATSRAWIKNYLKAEKIPCCTDCLSIYIVKLCNNRAIIKCSFTLLLKASKLRSLLGMISVFHLAFLYNLFCLYFFVHCSLSIPKMAKYYKKRTIFNIGSNKQIMWFEEHVNLWFIYFNSFPIFFWPNWFIHILWRANYFI